MGSKTQVRYNSIAIDSIKDETLKKYIHVMAWHYFNMIKKFKKEFERKG